MRSVLEPCYLLMFAPARGKQLLGFSGKREIILSAVKEEYRFFHFRNTLYRTVGHDICARNDAYPKHCFDRKRKQRMMIGDHMLSERIVEINIHSVRGHPCHVIGTAVGSKSEQPRRRTDTDAVYKNLAVAESVMKQFSPFENVSVLLISERTDLSFRKTVGAVVDRKNVLPRTAVRFRKIAAVKARLRASGNDYDSLVRAEIEIFAAESKSVAFNADFRHPR